MLATRFLRATATPRRLVHSTAVRASKAPGRDPQLSQGNVGLGSDSNRSKGDVQDQAASAGKDAKAEGDRPMDAASSSNQTAPGDKGGNQEAVGLQDQIGGASAEGKGGEMGGTEEAQAPGVLSSVKQALGMRTDAGDVKQNAGGGRGVTGTGTARKLHTSARVSAVRADPDGARAPADTGVVGEQSAHLKHKPAGAPDAGKGAAATEPTLPSERAPLTKSATDSAADKPHQQRRGLHTSARAGAEDGHSAASYFKDIDDQTVRDSSAPRAVDGTSSALDAPGETATGPFSQAGTDDASYKTTSKASPCVPPSRAYIRVRSRPRADTTSRTPSRARRAARSSATATSTSGTSTRAARPPTLATGPPARVRVAASPSEDSRTEPHIMYHSLAHRIEF
jgi:hypothetical protein